MRGVAGAERQKTTTYFKLHKSNQARIASYVGQLLTWREGSGENSTHSETTGRDIVTRFFFLVSSLYVMLLRNCQDGRAIYKGTFFFAFGFTCVGWTFFSVPLFPPLPSPFRCLNRHSPTLFLGGAVRPAHQRCGWVGWVGWLGLWVVGGSGSGSGRLQ